MSSPLPVTTPVDEEEPKDPATEPPEESKTKKALLQSRRDLWKTQLRLPFLMDPLREFVFDPSLKISTILLPPLARYLHADGFMAATISFTSLMPLSILLAVFENHDIPNVRDVASRSLLHPPSAGLPRFRPPSDFSSSIRGFFAFSFSAAADLVGALVNPKKMRKWLDALGNFRAYMHTSGVGAELEESMMKPLLRGRLLDNMKMLNDIQKLCDEERIKIARGGGDNDGLLQQTQQEENMELKRGSRMMRFATAAYGAEIIKSAVDFEVNVEQLESERKAIAFHTTVTEDDVKLLNVKDGGDMLTLRHYIAVNHVHKEVVLALRGTLSISGALIDMQAMDCSYCTGRAHQGIAEMADAVWKESGEFIIQLMAQEEYKGYDFVITGHSLGGGTATLLHVKIHVENLLPNHKVLCYGFAPPPTFCWDENTANCAAIEKALKTCVCYIHDNDCVPHLSVATIRRLSTLMDTVDNFNENVWFWKRGLIFWGWKPLPQELIQCVIRANKEISEKECSDCEMVIPARVVVWMKKDVKTETFEAIPCKPQSMAKLNIYVCEDMVSDHMPEQYEDALDAILDETK